MRTLTYAASLFVLLNLSSTTMASPKIGDKAPAVKVGKWMKDKAPSVPGDGESAKHVFVVEFWATWCGPCKRSIPHLTELQKKYAKDGLVIIGVSNEEQDVIEAFLKKGPEMAYYVAMDDDMATSDAWTDDIEGIPHAFIIDKTSSVVWSGNPLDTDSFDSTLKDVLAGKFDVEAAKKAAESQVKFDKLMKELQSMYGALEAIKDDVQRIEAEKKVIDILDKMIDVRPKDMRGYLIKRQLFREFGRDEDALKFDGAIEKAFWDSESDLRELAAMELKAEITSRNPGLIIRCASRANEISQGKNVESLAVLADVECQFGMLDEAIRHQTEAVGLATGPEAKAHKAALEYYKSVKSLRDARGSEAEGK